MSKNTQFKMASIRPCTFQGSTIVQSLLKEVWVNQSQKCNYGRAVFTSHLSCVGMEEGMMSSFLTH